MKRIAAMCAVALLCAGPCLAKSSTHTGSKHAGHEKGSGSSSHQKSSKSSKGSSSHHGGSGSGSKASKGQKHGGALAPAGSYSTPDPLNGLTPTCADGTSAPGQTTSSCPAPAPAPSGL